MDVERPFRFGVSLRFPATREEWRAKGRRAESLGYDILHVSDHLDAMSPPLTAIAFAAEATERIRIGTFVLNNDFRHPALLAREVAALDLLSGGRFELGLGAGHMEAEYRAAGLAFDPGPVRLARLGESLAVIGRLLAGEEVSVEGEHYRFDRYTSAPLPAQAKVPLLVGGNSRQVLRLAARHVDIVSFIGFFHPEGGRRVNLSHFTAEGLDDRLAIVREAAGDRFASRELNALIQSVVMTNDREREAAKWAARTPGVTAAQFLESPFVLFGTVAEMAEQLRQRRDRFGLSYFVVFEPAMEAFAAVIAELHRPT